MPSDLGECITNGLVIRNVLTSIGDILTVLLSFMFNEAEYLEDLTVGELGHGVLQ